MSTSNTGVSACTGNNFDLIGIAWQYPWGANSGVLSANINLGERVMCADRAIECLVFRVSGVEGGDTDVRLAL
jgi:hypothetical protein